MSQGNGTAARVQAIVHIKDYQVEIEIENMILIGKETGKEIEVMISTVIKEGTGTAKRVEAERGMIMTGKGAGTEIGTGTGEDGPNKNISGSLLAEICRLKLAFAIIGRFWQM